MNHPFADLRALLEAERWQEATAITRWVLLRDVFAPATVLDLDALWTTCSGGRFGFSAQVRVVGRAPPPAGDLQAGWAYACRVGTAVGWHDGQTWSRWQNTPYTSTYGSTIPTRGSAATFAEGCFPFHDAVTDDAWSTGFSPRDCWGESVWNTWCRVWRAVPQPGCARRRVPAPTSGG